MIQYLTDNVGVSPGETASGLMRAAIEHADGQLQDDAAVVVLMHENTELVR